MLASLSINLLTLALPLVILQAYDRIIPFGAYDTLAFLMLGLAGVLIVDAVLRGVRNYVTTWEAARFEHAIGQRAVDRLLGCSADAFERSPTGAHLDRLAAIEALRDFHSGQGLIAVSDVPFVVLFLAIIAIMDPWLVLPPVAVVAAAGAAAYFLGERLDAAVRQRAELDDERYNFLFQVFNAIHSVKGMGMEAQIHRQYRALLAPIAQAVDRSTFLAVVGRSLGTTFSNLSMASVAAFGSLKVIDGELTAGVLVAATLLAGRAVQPLLKMIGIWIQSRNLQLAEERLNMLMTLPQETPDITMPLPDIAGKIEFRHVSVRRENAAIAALNDVSFVIQPGQLIALVGPMGGGKSLLLEVIGGLIAPTEGEFLIDGMNFADVDPQKYRRQVGYARHHPVMYRGTIAENLTNFGGHKKLAAALDVAHAIGLDEEIARMPSGLDTLIGASADGALSSSVQQKVSLVRVLADKPRLLLFDQANSNMDMAADVRLRALFEDLRGTTTVVMITSRPSLIAWADRVFEVRNGQVTETAPSKQANIRVLPTPGAPKIVPPHATLGDAS